MKEGGGGGGREGGGGGGGRREEEEGGGRVWRREKGWGKKANEGKVNKRRICIVREWQKRRCNHCTHQDVKLVGSKVQLFQEGHVTH